jgi:hypothetical protein
MVFLAGVAAASADPAAGVVAATNPPTPGLAPAADPARATFATRDRDDGDEAPGLDRDADDAPRGSGVATGKRATGAEPLDREGEERGRLGAATIAADDKAAPSSSFAARFHPGARHIPRERPRDDADRLEKVERLKAREARARAAESALAGDHGPAPGGGRRPEGARRDGVEKFGVAPYKDVARRPLDPTERRARARTDAEFGATLD